MLYERFVQNKGRSYGSEHYRPYRHHLSARTIEKSGLCSLRSYDTCWSSLGIVDRCRHILYDGVQMTFHDAVSNAVAELLQY